MIDFYEFIKNCQSENMESLERQKLKNSLLGKTIKILFFDNIGLFTEHGFPVALIAYHKPSVKKPNGYFYAEVKRVEPMVTIYTIPEQGE